MTEGPVPGDVREFILNHIGSVAQLEALLLLRAQSAGQWRLSTIAERLYIKDAAAAEILNQLSVDGLVRSDASGVYTYNPGTPELRSMVDRLADAYARYLIPVTNIIHNNPLRLRRFADAFRFRKD